MDMAKIALLKVDAQLTDSRLAGIDMHILLQLRVPGEAFDGAALRPGNTCQDSNDAGWAVLREYGYGDYIRHRIGHGMGVEGHEAPWLSPGDDTVLAPTMVFSNEPGIYRPGIDGYRIIDSMVVTATGGERLSRYLSEHGPDDRVIEMG